jgi:hypothetical protein
MMRSKAVGLFLGVLLTGSCATVGTPEPPPTITIGDAMRVVADGLSELKVAMQGKEAGLIPSEVEVVFKITASSTDASVIAVDLSAPEPISIGIGGESKTEVKAERGNTVTLRFKNILLVDEKTLVASKDTKRIEEILTWIRSNLVMYLEP